MALLDAYEDQEYRVEYSTLVVRGSPWSTDLPPDLAHLNLDLLGEGAFAGWPKGDLGGAGNGWVLATTADRSQVLLEAHDAPPPLSEDVDRWEAVMESPFLTAGRGIVLTQVVSEHSARGVSLGRPGLYRVRLCRSRLGDRSRWLLRFWPVNGVPQPPRRLPCAQRGAARSEVKPDQDPWALAMDLVAMAMWSPGNATRADLAERLLATVEEIDAALQYATRHELLHVEEDEVTVTLAAVDRRPLAERDPEAAWRRHRAELRAWAEGNGVQTNVPGRIPAEVIDRFQQKRDRQDGV